MSDKVASMPGVRRVVRVGATGVAVVADTWWQAKTALDALPVVLDDGPNKSASSAAFAEVLKEGVTSDKDVFTGNKNGDALAAIAARPARSKRCMATRTRTTQRLNR